MMPKRRFLLHPDAQRFDHMELDVIERWKESELSGDEWRFSHVVRFFSHGREFACSGGLSVSDALRTATYVFDTIEIDYELYKQHLEEVCCQPGCPNPWTVLLHPNKRYTKSGEELARPYLEDDVRAFCERHSHRGDCALDDTDSNYTVVESRFPPDWGDEIETEGGDDG